MAVEPQEGSGEDSEVTTGRDADSSATADSTGRLSRRAYLASAASLLTAGCLANGEEDDVPRSLAPEIDSRTSVARDPTAAGYRLEATWTYDEVPYSAGYEVSREAYRQARTRQPAFYSSIYDRALTAPASQAVAQSVLRAVADAPVPSRLRERDSEVVAVPVDDSDAAVEVPHLAAFEAVRSFVQGLPYGEDGATTGRIEYCRHVEETLVDGIGDCEDYMAVAAGMFAQPPFEYDTVCAFLPDHITLAVARTDLPRAIRGDVPDSGTLSVDDTEYVFLDPVHDDPAGFDVEDADRVEAVYAGDGTWQHLRPTIMAETLLRTGVEVVTNVGTRIGGLL